MKVLRAGVHTSVAGGLPKAIETAQSLSADTLQIFSRNPRGWAARPIPKQEIDLFRGLRADSGLFPLVVHSCYLINLASQNPETIKRSIEAFRDEISRCIAIGADYLVVHPGATGGACAELGIENCIKSLHKALTGLPTAKLIILIENTAGQGSSIGRNYQQVKDILEGCVDLPVAACIDTAHSFASGYDLTTPEAVSKTLEELHSTIGLEYVKLIHCNDSKAGLGSRVDRHWHIGEGQIGVKGFSLLLKDERIRRIPFILETPVDHLHDERWNLETLRAIAARI